MQPRKPGQPHKGWKSSARETAAIRKMRAENERFRLALEIIAGRRQCIDNLMSNVEVAQAALDQ